MLITESIPKILSPISIPVRWYLAVGITVVLFVGRLVIDAWGYSTNSKSFWGKLRDTWNQLWRYCTHPLVAVINMFIYVVQLIFIRAWIASSGFWLALYLLQNGITVDDPFHHMGIALWFALIVCGLPSLVLITCTEAGIMTTVIIAVILAIISGVAAMTYAAYGIWGDFWVLGFGLLFQGFRERVRGYLWYYPFYRIP